MRHELHRSALDRIPGWRDHAPHGDFLWVDVAAQRVWSFRGFAVDGGYRCSTAAAGLGEDEGSYRTPRGWHRIAESIGTGLPTGAVLESRHWTGRVWQPGDSNGPSERSRGAAADDVDLILSRVLWLEGCEPGRNRGGARDTHARFIYIHGTNHPERLGKPASHGCVRLSAEDVVALAETVSVGHPVWIG